MIRIIFKVFLMFLPTLFALASYEIIKLSFSKSSQKKPIPKANPMIQPLTGLTQRLDKTNKLVIYNNRYFQYQLKKDGKWILHNLNGPAVYDAGSKRTAFFIEGIEYEDEFQYLVAKGDYENANT